MSQAKMSKPSAKLLTSRQRDRSKSRERTRGSSARREKSPDPRPSARLQRPREAEDELQSSSASSRDKKVTFPKKESRPKVTLRVEEPTGKSADPTGPPPLPPKQRYVPELRTNVEDESIYENTEQDSREEETESMYTGSSEISYREVSRMNAKPVFNPPVSSRAIDKVRPAAVNLKRPRMIQRGSRQPLAQPVNTDSESIGLEIEETPAVNQRRPTPSLYERAPSTISDYGTHEPKPYQPLSTVRKPAASPVARVEERTGNRRTRTFPPASFMMAIGGLIVVLLVCIVLVLAIQKGDIRLRIAILVAFAYIYAVSIVWMIWATVDIVRFRREWAKITSSAIDQDDYMEVAQKHTHKLSYFPDIHNTGGLFMRVGAGLFCMGSLILTVIELAKAILTSRSSATHRAAALDDDPQSVAIARSVTYAFRLLFHCVQFTFLFRYGNLIINRYRELAQLGLIHVVIANFGTWFEAIVFETLEQIDHLPKETQSTTLPAVLANTTRMMTAYTSDSINTIVIRAVTGVVVAAGAPGDPLAFIKNIEATVSPYLYPCLIEYSLISLTVFVIMWRNVGKDETGSYRRFGDRHIFTINCSRASRGLLIGGIIILLTILTLIPTYLLEKDGPSVTQITELSLLIVSFILVSASYFHTTTLFYDKNAHVDVFDQVLIMLTTVGDFAYTSFGLVASLLLPRERSPSATRRGIEIAIGIVAMIQVMFQSSFILETLKRRCNNKHDIRNKPGRETVTALLLINLAIWLHDTLSAKKVNFNTFQTGYYEGTTWAIIQAFTSPLSIFYRFHSSVCLADIWQATYQDSSVGEAPRAGQKLTLNSLH